MEKSNKSPHILTTSATLFGLCYVVFSSLHALKLEKETLIDEFTSASMFLFLISCIFSFLSIRSNTVRAGLYDKIADYTFLVGLLALFVTTLLLALHIVK
jgi:predicted membrane channel-forming protein YqfA (hemolysin III family)